MKKGDGFSLREQMCRSIRKLSCFPQIFRFRHYRPVCEAHFGLSGYLVPFCNVFPLMGLNKGSWRRQEQPSGLLALHVVL